MQYYYSHKPEESNSQHKYYDSIKNTVEFKQKKHDYYMNRKNTPEYKAYKKENNRRYRERKKAERVS